MALLEYEKQIFLDSFQEDGLLIMARGLGIERIFVDFLKVYSDPGGLVLVLNTISAEEEYLIHQLKQKASSPLPKVITTEYSAVERQKIYLEGGVLFVTSRILVVDMLTNKIPIDLITGILVYKAHRIMESCQEAFILRLYRQKNKKGFVKAFSDHPQAFTAGFCHVERVMKSLFVRKLFLWPRFHASVVSSMEQNKVDVVELHVQMTPAMVACQTAILDLISGCIKELKRGNPSFDTDEITVEHAITRGFDKLVKLHLDPVWHQLSPKSKQLVSDLRTLRLILEYLTQYDCVNFYNLVHSIRSSEKAFSKNSGWLFMDAADGLIVHAKERVFGPLNSKKQKTEDDKSAKLEEPLLEECPKWSVLNNVLDEIEEENKRLSDKLGHGRVLIAAADDRTCSQIRQYLCGGGRELLQKLYNKSLAIRKSSKIQEQVKRSPEKGQGKAKAKVSPRINNGLTLTQMIDTNDSDEEISKNKQAEPKVGNTDGPLSSEVITDSGAGNELPASTVIHPLHGTNDPNALVQELESVQPRFVILYDADMVFVRQIEVYKATHRDRPLRVYFLMYTGSCEEQRYLTVLRKEKEAFEYLIKEKATMVVPEEREGKLDDDTSLIRDITPANETVNTRKGGLHETQGPQQIIVDMREFRSELPSLIHRRGIDIEPVTLEVGDYILTPDICVERKSLSDLIGSLNNGRLYNQCVSMCRYYKRPVLLIEFDANKSFSLQGKYSISSEINSQDTMSKLTLLTLHFKKLRIFWCQSPYATAELFEELKVGRAQPDAAAAMTVAGDLENSLNSGKYNHGPQDMLLKMPGINSKNCSAIFNKVEDLAELVTLSEKDLSDILGSEHNAKLLHDFLHYDHSINAADAITSKPGPSKGKGTMFKGVKRKK